MTEPAGELELYANNMTSERTTLRDLVKREVASVGRIVVSEEDFYHLSAAANAALDRGDLEAAAALDKIARKANAALSRSKYPNFSGRREAFGWEDAPSTLIHNPRYKP